MTFEEFAKDAEELGRGHAVRVERDPHAPIITAYGRDATQADLARRGLCSIADLAEHAAEHHPRWAALSGCAGLLEALLDGWDERGPGDVGQMRWELERIARALDR